MHCVTQRWHSSPRVGALVRACFDIFDADRLRQRPVDMPIVRACFAPPAGDVNVER
jgi:phytoene dehydrogenase-like protein